MTEFRARPQTAADDEAWDALVATSWNGTFLHTRRYLASTPTGTPDASLVIEDTRGRLVAVVPAAVHATDATMVESHPALGYGGIVHDGALTGERMVAALETVADRFYHDGYRSLRYKASPQIYHRIPAADDLYALFRMGAVRSRCDLASVIDLLERPQPSARRIRSLRKARRAGVEVLERADRLDALFSVIAGRLADKYGAEPLHDAAALRDVQRTFPDRVICTVGLVDGSVVAGVVVFRTGTVDHAQYIAADDLGYKAAALDAVITAAADSSAARGARYFSLGNNTLYGGRVFNEALHTFKSGFGAGTVVHDCYDLRLG